MTESVNPADRTMMAYLPNEDGKPGERVELYVDENHQNAQRYFATVERSKINQRVQKRLWKTLLENNGKKRNNEQRMKPQAELGK